MDAGKIPAGVTVEVTPDPFVWILRVTAPVRGCPCLTPQARYTVAGAIRDCPYGGRVFPVRIRFPKEYPHKEPEASFEVGALYHPNVNAEDGRICGGDALRWGSTKNVSHIGEFIMSFLATPMPDHAVDVEAAREMLENVPLYESKARGAARK